MIEVKYDLPEFCKNCVYLDTDKEENVNYGINYEIQSVDYSCTYAEMCEYLHAKWEKERGYKKS